MQTYLKASIANFNNQEKTLYLIFDFVHIIKTVRNNWINQIDSNHTFSCPSFVSCESTLNVPFQVLRNLFKLEQNSVAKTAHRLTAKSCWPSSLERQNVNLAQQDWILSQKPLLVQSRTSPMCILLRRNSCRNFLTRPPTMSPLGKIPLTQHAMSWRHKHSRPWSTSTLVKIHTYRVIF